jgi:hypothetical protein
MRNNKQYSTPTILKKPGAGTDTQYPGKALGMSLEQVKKFVQNQPKSIGDRINLVVGVNPNFKIQLPGDASYFIGIGFNVLLDADFTLNVNQTVIHQNIGTEFATVGFNGGLGMQTFYPVGMPVAGNDTIKLDFNSTVAETLKILIYYK